MKTSEKINISLRKLVGLPNNPRKITQADLNKLCDSIRNNGYWEHRPAAVEPIEGTDTYQVLDGNQRLKAMRRLKRKDMPCVIYTELTDEERTDLILRSNVNNGQWDVDLLATEFEGVELEDIGLTIDLPEPPVIETTLTVAPTVQREAPVAPREAPRDEDEDEVEQLTDEEETTQEEAYMTEEEEQREERIAFYKKMMGDFLYPSDNDYEIPLLLDDNQPVHLELPFTPWGAEGRYKKGITTYHFYVDDYRFEQIFKDPIKLLDSGCRAIVEPNCSVHDQTPIAYGIYQIYRKRYLARYLQECGLKVWVDLNVSHRFAEYNLLGVPDGYNAFFTRGVTGWTPHLDMCLEMAKRKSGLEKPNLYVYGGGKESERWCQEHGLRYLDEYMNIRRAEQRRSKP